MSLKLDTSAEGPNAGKDPVTLQNISKLWRKCQEAVDLLKQTTEALDEATDMAFPYGYEPVGQRQRERRYIRHRLEREAKRVEDLRIELQKFEWFDEAKRQPQE